ncbi:adenosylmethionine decarboxylase [Bacillus oleivorans]|uniref:adenosylmethionine decarboxylase n=1 Tax=Bacillus oleivorans TaxID=1448271 RepID=UPI0033921CAE
MDTNGVHFIIDAFSCDDQILNDANLLENILKKAVSDLGMVMLSSRFHTFSPQGVTGVIVLSTSHISIHTWPEHRYASIDLYTCGNPNWPVLNELLLTLKAEKAHVYEISRGNEHISSPAWKEISLTANSTQDDIKKKVIEIKEKQGNDWDKLQLKEILEDKHQIYHSESTPFQDILLLEVNDLRLYLNQELQFSSLDERHYHEALVYPVMENAKKHERVLILGGGDGLALREVLKYPDVLHVDLVDIDRKIIELAKTNPKLLVLNMGSFHDERVSVHTEDAKKFIDRKQEPYDVIFIDFPDPADPIISSLYTKEVFKQITNLLEQDGVLVCQSGSPEDTPTVYWSIAKTLESAGLFTRGYVSVVPSFGLWGFHLASRLDLRSIKFNISVPHRALKDDTSYLFKLPDKLVSMQKNAFINSKDSLELHNHYLRELKIMY